MTTWPFQTKLTVSDVLFRPDGGVVMEEIQPDPPFVRLVALDPVGQVQPGWPWIAPALGASVGYPSVEGALAPDGTIVVVVGTKSGGQALHRLDRAGKELAGYPIQVATYGTCQVPVVAPSGTAYVTCDLMDTPDADVARAVTYAFRPDGSTVSGWSVHTGPTTGAAQLAANGTLYLTIAKKGGTRLVALGPDGRLRAGWPRLVPEGASLTLGPAGRVWVTWRVYGADSGECGLPVWTRYEVLGRDGRKVRGWPVSIHGWSSDPTVARSGTTTIATQAGRLVAYSLAGVVRAGFPTAIPIRPAACYGGSIPQLAGAGNVLIAGSTVRFGPGPANGSIALMTRTGSSVAGWPVKVGYELATECRSCTPGPGAIVLPAIGARRIYVGAYSGDRPRVVVLDRAGHRPPAAQRHLATGGSWELAWIRIAPTGRVWTLIVGQEGGGILQPIAQDGVLPAP